MINSSLCSGFKNFSTFHEPVTMASFSASEGSNTKPRFMSCLNFSAVLVALLALFCVASIHNQVVLLRAEVEALRNTANEHCTQKLKNDEESLEQQFDNQRAMASNDDDDGDDYVDDVDDDDDEDDDVTNNHDDDVDNGDDSFSKLNILNQPGNRKLLSVLANVEPQRIRRNSSGKKKKGRKKKGLDMVKFVSTAGPRHPLGIIDDWHYADWVTRKMKKQFSLGLKPPNLGKVEIKFGGFLLAIAQITYTGMRDREFKIVKEEKGTKKLETIACCVQAMRLTRVHNDSSAMSTCHTSSILSVAKGDSVYVTETIAGSGATFEAGYSFLSFIRLG